MADLLWSVAGVGALFVLAWVGLTLLRSTRDVQAINDLVEQAARTAQTTRDRDAERRAYEDRCLELVRGMPEAMWPRVLTAFELRAARDAARRAAGRE